MSNKKNKKKKIKRGDIYLGDLSPTIGSEQSGKRPVVVLQNDIGNRYSPTVLVAPITSKSKKKLPTHILINNIKNLRHDSIILLEQTRVLDKSRLKNYISQLTDKEMKEVEKAISISFGLSTKLSSVQKK